MFSQSRIGARYGVWGMDPYGPTIKRTPAIETAIKTAEGIGNLFAKRYENQQNQAKAQLAQDTLGSKIAAENAMNEANRVNYPLQQALKTQQEQAAIKEIMARTGVSYAQARHIAAQTGLVNTQQQMLTDPTFQLKAMMGQWEKAPVDSPLKMALGRMLDMQFGGMFPAANKGAKGQAMPMGAMGGWVKDPRMGPSRGGQGGTYIDPMTGQAVSTDSLSNITQDQKTIGAVQRATPLIEEIVKMQAPFMTATGKGKLAMARLGNLFGGNNPAPSQKATADADAELAAESLIKAYGLNVTDQSANMMKAAIKPVTGESADAYRARLTNTLGTIATNQREAEDRLKGGIPLGQSEPMMGFFSQRSMSEPPAPQQRAPQMDLSAMAEQAIAMGADPAAVKARLEQLQRGQQ